MNKAIAFIVLTMILDATGIGLIVPVMPALLNELQGSTDLGEAAIWGGILATSFAVMQFLFGPLLGSLSDRFGRRPVLLLSLAVMVFDYLIMAYAATIWVLFIGRLIGGIAAATHATANAFVADISTPAEKAARFGLVGAGFGVGFILGPLFGGLLSEWGTRAPFFVAAALAFCNLALGYFVLPETVTDKIRRPFQWRNANPLTGFQNMRRFASVRALLFVYFLYVLATAVYPAVWAFFTAERFGWSPDLVGMSLALYGVFFVIVQGFLVKPASRFFGEARLVLIGFLIEFVSLVAIALINAGWLLLVFIPISALGLLGQPALQAILSKRVDMSHQGALQGIMTSLNALATIIAPIVMTQSFAYFSDKSGAIYAPGAPFFLSALLMLLALIYYLRIWRHAGAPET